MTPHAMIVRSLPFGEHLALAERERRVLVRHHRHVSRPNRM
jgi:hypothetical protein